MLLGVPPAPRDRASALQRCAEPVPLITPAASASYFDDQGDHADFERALWEMPRMLHTGCSRWIAWHCLFLRPHALCSYCAVHVYLCVCAVWWLCCMFEFFGFI